MSKTAWIMLFISLSAIINTSAQEVTLSGKIVDQSGRPLEYVETALYADHSAKIKSIFSDTLGYFKIQVKKNSYQFKVLQFGSVLLTKDITLDHDTDLGVLQIDKAINLETVVIQGNKGIITQQQDKLIFNVENSPLKNGYNGLEVLKRSPKLRINPEGDILLRNSSVLVLVNGRKMTLSGEELSGYLRSLRSENIKKIEIQTVGSAETDASNSGGVINIVLKKVPTGFQSTLQSSYTYRDKNHSTNFGSINNQFGSEKWNIYSKISYSDYSNLSKYNSTTRFYDFDGRNENGGETENRNRNLNAIAGIVFYPNKRSEIGAEGYFSNNKTDRNGLEILNIFEPQLNATSTNKSLYYNKTIFWNATLNYTYKLDSIGSKLKFIGDVGNNDLHNRNEVDTRYTFGTLQDNYNRFLTNAKSNFYNLQTDLVQKLENSWELTTGIKLSRVSRNNQLYNYIFENEWKPLNSGNQNFKNDETILAGYASVSKQFDKKNSIKLGLRTEYTKLKGTDYINSLNINKSYFDWFPNLYYGYEIKQDQSLSFSYSRRIQRPSFRDLSPFVIKQNDFLYQLGNPDLKPQYTNKLDFTYQQKNQSFSIFCNLTNDLIAGIYSTENNVSYYRPQNFGKSRNIGIDYSYHGDITKWLYSNISIGVMNYDFKSGSSKQNRFSFYNTISTQAKFSKTFFLDITHDFTSKSQYQVVELAKQYELDLALQKSIWKGAGIIRLSCDDVFNTQRDSNISYYKNFDFRFYQKRITRMASLMFTYTFKNRTNFNTRKVQQGNENKGRL
ncbi:TonB-dependent receptor [Pedobacter sp. PAMC26386]|nr:TonB-dependent receptor [Pedobacter sp. PAMC26386]